jgi:hypothetical protein
MKKLLMGIVTSSLCISLVMPCAATERMRRTQSSASVKDQSNSHRVEDYEVGEHGVEALNSLLDGIHVGTPTVEELAVLYDRHKAEIHAIFDQHLDLVWETMDVIVEALPALRSVDKAGGRLYLDKRTYSKANRIFEQYVALAGSGLAKDLRKAREQFDVRTENWGSNQVMIDLND